MKDKQKKLKYKKCIFCDGTGKVPKKKEVRRKCKECQDYNHGCFGTTNKNGLGHTWCIDYIDVYED